MTDRKKKILYVITKSNFGGAQRYVYELAAGLPRDEYEVVVAFGGNGILKDKLEAADIRTVTIDSFQRDISLGKELRSLRELWRIYKAEKPDVVHLNSSKAGGTGALVARLVGIKCIVYTTHGFAFLEPRSLIWRTLVWIGAYITTLLCHKVILVSEFETKHTHMPFIDRKFKVINTALPYIAFKSREEARRELFDTATIDKHQSDLWLVTNAELNPNKNLFAAIDAVVEYNQHNTHKIFYSIISDGELRDALTEYIKEKRAEEFIALLGYIDDARAYLKAFAIFLLPSKKEGMPYAILEAGAAHLPVIASRVGGIPEIITDGESGLLIDPNNTETITNALIKLANDKQLREHLSQVLEDKIKLDFNLTDMIKRTISLY